MGQLNGCGSRNAFWRGDTVMVKVPRLALGMTDEAVWVL